MIFQRKTADADSGAVGRGMLLLEKVDKTTEEKAAAGAFRRMMIGAFLLTAGMVVSLCAVMVRFDPVLGSGTRRYGIVAQDQSVRLTEETDQDASLEELGLEGYNLSEGERIILFYDNRSEELEAAYPQNWYEQYTQARVGIIIGVAMLWITLLILYAAACRLTPFAKAWFLYCRAQRKEERETLQKKEVGTDIAAYVFLAVMVLLTCWPQIASLREHLDVMRGIEVVGELSREDNQAESLPLE